MFNDDKSQRKAFSLCSAIWSLQTGSRSCVSMAEGKVKIGKCKVNENKETNEERMCIVHISSKNRNQ